MNTFSCFKLSRKVLFYNNYLMTTYSKIDHVTSTLKLGNQYFTVTIGKTLGTKEDNPKRGVHFDKVSFNDRSIM